MGQIKHFVLAVITDMSFLLLLSRNFCKLRSAFITATNVNLGKLCPLAIICVPTERASMTRQSAFACISVTL